MSASLRFLAVALVGWVGIRAASLGVVPGMEGMAVRETTAQAAVPSTVPPIATTDLTAALPMEGAAMAEPLVAATGPYPAQPLPVSYYPVALPYRQPVMLPAALPRSRAGTLTPLLPEPEPLFYSQLPQLDEWPLSRMASTPLPPRRSAAAEPQQSAPAAAVRAKLDRLQLTTWALLRGQQGQLFGDTSLSTGGTLGASQAGMRLTYAVTPMIAASLRSSSTIGRRGGEIAGGVRVTPFRTIPVSVTAERRQAIGRYGGGRSAFALFAEAGLYRRPLAGGFNLDGYLQGGVVGLRSRDLFIDGAATLTRPLFGRYSAGVGIWGGAQPGLYRIDGGPRISMEVRRNVRIHLDWRQKLAGNAQPGSGPALTLAGDF